MSNLGMDKVPKKQLVNATLDFMRNSGLSGASASQVSVRAGIVNGMVSRHFTDMDALFKAKYSELPVRMAQELLARLGDTQFLFERVHASADGILNAESLAEAKVAVWLTFGAQVSDVPGFKRIPDSITRRAQMARFRTSKMLAPRGKFSRRFAHELPSRQLGAPMAKLDRPCIQ